MIAYLKNFYLKNRYAKFLTLGLMFIWLGGILGAVGVVGSIVVCAWLTAAVFLLIAIFSGVRQHDMREFE